MIVEEGFCSGEGGGFYGGVGLMTGEGGRALGRGVERRG